MKIIFLNTWRAELRDELRAYVEQHVGTTAVFCFQEADDEHRAAYEDLLTDDFTLHTAQRQEADGSWYGNAMYIRHDITITKKGSIFIEHTQDLEVGIAAFATLRIGSTELTICNVHGVSQPGDKHDTPARLYQSQTILDTFAHQNHVIIGGDFNLLPETRSVHTFVEHGYRNLIADFSISSTRNRITYEKYPESIQHFADYAFVSLDITVDTFVVPEEVVSDHQPLELTISL